MVCQEQPLHQTKKMAKMNVVLAGLALVLCAASISQAAATGKTVAVIACDFEPDILSGYAADDLARLLQVGSKVLNASRNAGFLTVYTRVAFKAGYPEVSPRNMMFTQLAKQGLLKEGTAGTTIVPEVSPQDGDLVLTKTRVGAFSTTDLRTILGAHNINEIVLFGVSTSGVILSTVRDAADQDFTVTVLSDACADHTPEVHDVLLKQVFPRQATVTTAAEWVKSLAL
eukprot:Opistho-2@59885